MRVRLSCVVLAMFLVPALAHADGHKADLFGGITFGDGGSTVTGVRQAVAFGTKVRWFSVVAADIDTRFGKHDGKALTQFVWHLGGARFTLNPDARCKVFAQVIGGAVYTNDGTDAAGNNGSGAIGLGVEYAFGERAAEPPGPYLGLGFRVQYDYITRAGTRENFSRVSAGFVYRIAKH